MPVARIFLQLIADFVVYLGLLVRRRKAIAAENLFRRRQLALYHNASGQSFPFLRTTAVLSDKAQTGPGRTSESAVLAALNVENGNTALPSG